MNALPPEPSTSRLNVTRGEIRARLEKPDVEAVYEGKGSDSDVVKEARSYGDPLDFYLRRGFLQNDHRAKSARELILAMDRHLAGVTFAEAHYHGFLALGHVQVKYEPSAGGGHQHDRPHMIYKASQEFLHARRAVSDPEVRKVVFEVCCEGKYAGIGKVRLLRQGLDELVRHYQH